MQNATQPFIIQRDPDESGYSFAGVISGFVFYWLAFASLFLIYGSNVLFFLLYTWPFFLALIPVSLLIGFLCSILLKNHQWLIIFVSGILVVCLFWLVFLVLRGW